MLRIGIIGSLFAALCCFTPFLPWFLGAVGLGSLAAALYNDAILLPFLGIFLLITSYALWRKQKSSD